jgi:NAD(P)-dependent dehydrogenase (short-subunit alcohol dehydrogenase family)
LRVTALDVLVNNAYGWSPARSSAQDRRLARDVGPRSTPPSSACAACHTWRSGIGAIVNVSGDGGHAGPGIGAYASAKAALESLTRTAAVNRPHVRVNTSRRA